MHYDIAVRRSLLRPLATVIGILGICLFSFALFPLLGLGFFPRTDPGQFVINIKAPTGTRLELTNQYIKARRSRHSSGGFAAGSEHDRLQYRHHSGFLCDLHQQFRAAHGIRAGEPQERSPVGSYEYMRRVRAKLTDDLPELSTYFQSGGLVDAVVNLGLPAPIDIQVSGNDQKQAYQTAAEIAAKGAPASAA